MSPDETTTPDVQTADAGSLTPDQVDALLRDPNTPGDVRASVLATYTVNRHLDTVEFHTDDGGVVSVRPRAEPAPETEPGS